MHELRMGYDAEIGPTQDGPTTFNFLFTCEDKKSKGDRIWCDMVEFNGETLYMARRNYKMSDKEKIYNYLMFRLESFLKTHPEDKEEIVKIDELIEELYDITEEG